MKRVLRERMVRPQEEEIAASHQRRGKGAKPNRDTEPRHSFTQQLRGKEKGVY